MILANQDEHKYSNVNRALSFINNSNKSSTDHFQNLKMTRLTRRAKPNVHSNHGKTRLLISIITRVLWWKRLQQLLSWQGAVKHSYECGKDVVRYIAVYELDLWSYYFNSYLLKHIFLPRCILLLHSIRVKLTPKCLTHFEMLTPLLKRKYKSKCRIFLQYIYSILRVYFIPLVE